MLLLKLSTVSFVFENAMRSVVHLDNAGEVGGHGQYALRDALPR